MIFNCNLCGDKMDNLTTPGDEINDNLICPKCAKQIMEAIHRIKKLRTSVLDLIGNPN